MLRLETQLCPHLRNATYSCPHLLIAARRLEEGAGHKDEGRVSQGLGLKRTMLGQECQAKDRKDGQGMVFCHAPRSGSAPASGASGLLLV